MNNKSTDTNDATETRNEVKLTGISIDEPGTDETNVTVEIQVPFEFYLHGRRSLDEYERIAIEDLRIKASAIFEHIGLLNHLCENSDIDKNSYISILHPLSNFGKGLIEAQEIIQMSFERYRKGIPQPHERKAEAEPFKITPEFSDLMEKFNESQKRLTVEERRNFDRRAIAEWLLNASNSGTPAIKRLAGSLLTELEFDTQALNTPAHIENVLLEYDKLIEENPNDEKALNAAGKLFDLAHDPKATDSEISGQMVNIADGWLNPEGGTFSEDDDETEKDVLDLSAVCTEFLKTKEATEKPIDLAVLLSAVMKHPETPTPIYEALGDILIELPEGLSERPEIIQETLDRYSEEERKSDE